MIILSPLARLLFPAVDDNLLKYNYDDNLRVEPEWYIPIIPLVLANGGEGIGTGWASRIPNYDVREIINNIHRMLNGEDPLPMVKINSCFKFNYHKCIVVFIMHIVLNQNWLMYSFCPFMSSCQAIRGSKAPLMNWRRISM